MGNKNRPFEMTRYKRSHICSGNRRLQNIRWQPKAANLPSLHKKSPKDRSGKKDIRDVKKINSKTRLIQASVSVIRSIDHKNE